MPVPIAELFVSVGADISGATAGLNQLNSQLQNIGNSAGKSFSLSNIGRGLKNVGSQAQIIGRDLTAGVTLPLLAVGGAVFKAGTDFENSFAQVQRTVDGLSAEQLDQFRKDLLEMSKTSAGGGSTASDLAQIAAAGGEVGVAGGDIKEFTSLVARLSLATKLPFGEITDDIGRSINVMHLAKDDFEAFGSSVTDLGNKFGGTEQDIFQFTRRLAGTLTTVGVKPDQILAIGAALSAAGVEPEAGATAINQFFTEMVNALNDTGTASDEAKQKLQSLKDSVSDLSGNLEVAQLRQKEFGRNTPASVVRANQIAIEKYQRDLGQANTKLDDFSKTSAEGKLTIGGMAKVAGQTDDEFRNLVKTDPARAFAAFIGGLQTLNKEKGPEAVTKALEELGINGERQRLAFLNLANAQQSLTSALDISKGAWDEQKALQAEVDTQMKTTTSQIKLLGNSIQTDLIDQFDKNRPAIQQFLNDFKQAQPTIDAFFKGISAISPDQFKFIAILLGLGPAIGFLGTIVSLLGSLALILGAPAVLAGAGIFLAIAAAVAGLAVAFNQVATNWENFRTLLLASNLPFAQALVGAIDFFKTNGDAIKATISGLVDFVRRVGFAQAFADALTTAGQLFSVFGTFLNNFFNTVLLPIFERFKGWISEHILGAIIGLLQALQNMGITSLPGVGNIGTTISDLQAKQTGATAAAAGGTNVEVTINNPQVTSQDLLDKLKQQTADVLFDALIAAERSAIIPPQPLPGQLPGTPF